MTVEQRFTNALIFVLLALTWGSSFILMKKGLIVFDGVQVALLRVVFATLFILSFGWRKLKNFQKKDLPALSIVALFGNGIPYILFAWALMYIDSSIGGITNSLTPLFTLIVGSIIFKTRVRFLQILGIALGLFGAIYMINPGENAALGDNWPYALLPIAAAVMYGVGINTINAKLQHLDSISITLLALVIAGIPAIIALFTLTDFVHLVTSDERALMSMGYILILGVMGTGLAIILFNYLIKKSSALYAASITYLVPMVALAWGVADGELLTSAHLIGMVSILSGIYLVNAHKKKA